MRKNQEVFAWSHKDMAGIDPAVISHVLNIDKTFPPIQQKRRLLDKDRSRALKEEVERLKENRFIRVAFYPSWVSNPVLVPKPKGKWRTCVDFTDLNKACPRIVSHSLGSTNWSMPLQGMRFSHSWMHTHGIIRFVCILLMRITLAFGLIQGFTVTK